MKNEINNSQNDLKENILSKIDSGDIRMKPKIYFTVKTILVLLAITITVSVLYFLVSFMVFSIRASGKLLLLGFGNAGIWTFFITFPWILLIIEIVLLIGVDILLKYFKFAYKTPFIYLILGTTALVVSISFLIPAIPVHETIYQEVTEQNIPFLNIIYENAKRLPEENGVFRGIVISIDDDSLTIFNKSYDTNEEDKRKTISISKNQLKYKNAVSIGDSVVVACTQRKNGLCYLYGLKNLTKEK